MSRTQIAWKASARSSAAWRPTTLPPVFHSKQTVLRRELRGGSVFHIALLHGARFFDNILVAKLQQFEEIVSIPSAVTGLPPSRLGHM